jgi:hypothetical protein
MGLYDMLQSSSNNNGGHSRIASIIHADEVDPASFPALVGGSFADEATFAVGDIIALATFKWHKITSETEQIGSAVSSEGSKGSMTPISSPKLRFNNLSAAELGFLKSIANQPVIICLEAANGEKFIYGSVTTPCMVSEIGGDFGTGVGDDKFAEVTFRAVDIPTLYPGSISYGVVA